MFFRQPVVIPKTATASGRLYFAFGLWFVFFTVSVYECLIFADLVALDNKIETLEELTSSRNILLIADPFAYDTIMIAQYNLSTEFLEKMEEVKDSPWTTNDYEILDYAYVFPMDTNHFFFDSVFNVDDFGLKRFRLMDHVISTIPLVYVFPRNSPFAHLFQNFYGRVQEAGLRSYWETRVLRRDRWKIWKSFKVVRRDALVKLTAKNQLRRALLVLLTGLGVASFVFVLEILQYRMKRLVKIWLFRRQMKRRVKKIKVILKRHSERQKVRVTKK